MGRTTGAPRDGRAAPSTSPGMVTHVSGAREGTILQESDRSLEISGCDWTGTDCELARNLCNHTTRLTPKTTFDQLLIPLGIVLMEFAYGTVSAVLERLPQALARLLSDRHVPGVIIERRVSFRQINKKTRNRLKQQLADSVTGDLIESADKGHGYEIGRNQYMPVEDEELESLRLESTHTIDIEKFVPRSKGEELYLDSPYYLTPQDHVG